MRPLRLDLWLPPLVLMGAIFALSAQPSLDSGLGWIDHVGRKLIHFGEYALLCFLWWRALASVTTPRRAALLAFLIASGAPLDAAGTDRVEPTDRDVRGGAARHRHGRARGGRRHRLPVPGPRRGRADRVRPVVGRSDRGRARGAELRPP